MNRGFDSMITITNKYKWKEMTLSWIFKQGRQTRASCGFLLYFLIFSQRTIPAAHFLQK